MAPPATDATRRRDRPAERRRLGRVAGVAITAILASTLAPGGAAPAFAATPPVAPDNIVIFPDRDFVTLEGYAAHVGQTATITVTRGGVVSGMAQGTIGAGDPALEVNHPGGVAWGTGPGAPKVTQGR